MICHPLQIKIWVGCRHDFHPLLPVLPPADSISGQVTRHPPPPPLSHTMSIRLVNENQVSLSKIGSEKHNSDEHLNKTAPKSASGEKFEHFGHSWCLNRPIRFVSQVKPWIRIKRMCVESPLCPLSVSIRVIVFPTTFV